MEYSTAVLQDVYRVFSNTGKGLEFHEGSENNQKGVHTVCLRPEEGRGLGSAPPLFQGGGLTNWAGHTPGGWFPVPYRPGRECGPLSCLLNATLWPSPLLHTQQEQ